MNEVNDMSKKDVMKEVAKLIRSILEEGGYDSSGRVRLYQELSVECLVYGHKDIRDYVISELEQYSQFRYDSDVDMYWTDGKYRIYISIV